MSRSPNPVQAQAPVLTLLDRLHRQSEEQEAVIRPGHSNPTSADTGQPISALPDFKDLMVDKFIALDQDKCQFVYQLLRATGGTTAVEAGTSFGGQNAAAKPGCNAKVIATEHEPSKAAKAREYWAECGSEVEQHIDLREGDLLQTLAEGVEEVDLLLLDIWTPMALPALKLVQPHLRRGAIVLTDNTARYAQSYRELLEYLRRNGSGFINSTLPFDKGLEMSVYLPS